MSRALRWISRAAFALAALALVFCAGCVIGARFGVPPTRMVTTHEAPPEDPIEAFRQERERRRELWLAQLNEIIHDPRNGAELVDAAQRQRMALMESSDMEATLEGVLLARGFQDVLATVRRRSVNVLLRGDPLTAQQAATILEFVTRETGVSAGNVKIIPVK